MARTKRNLSASEELHRWRDGLDQALSPKKGSVGRRIARSLATVLALVGIVFAGAVAWFYKDIEAMLTKISVRVEEAAGSSVNVLVIGSDSRDGLSGEDASRFGDAGGKRADTIMLVQVNPGEPRASILHFPRDLWVEKHDGRKGKINSSYNDGPQGVIDTVQGLTGIPVNHYVEVNISGFRNMVDAIGGVDICLENRIYDSKLNFSLPAGTSTLNGEQALSFVRARQATPDGDFGRIRRQQQFLRSVVSKVGSPSTLANPARVKSLAEAFASNVTVDETFNINDMIRIAADVKRIGLDNIQTFSVPGDTGRAGNQSVVLMDTREAYRIFDAFRQQTNPSQALWPHVTVIDGTGAGIGQRIADELKNHGIIIDGVAPARELQQNTVVSAPSSLSGDADKVFRAISGGRRANGGDTITLTLGADFGGVKPIEAPPAAPGTEPLKGAC